MLYVEKAEYVGGYSLNVTFSDRRSGTVDLTDTVLHDHRPIFRELADTSKFQRFHVEADTVVWENGLDLAPEYLAMKLKNPVTNDEFFSKMNS